MQNFTFGRKGTNWFLFAFVLLIGTLPSFGQEDCPEAGDFPATQDFCYLETIDDLDTDGNPVFQTNQVGDNQPIPGDELLEGTTYYIGGENCAPENRLPLEVNVTSAPRPVNQITDSRTQGFEFTTCASEDFDSEDLASLFEADTDYDIEVYESEFGETPYNGVLNPGGSYFVGQVSTGNCPSLRTAIGFNPNEIEGPSAEATQTFCEAATVADLVAQGTYDDTQAIRWYRSQTANSPISAGTQLINGVTYFAAQVVNERGSVTPPCETPSGERTPVEVTLEEGPEAGDDAVGIVCESDVQETFPGRPEIREFYLNLLEDGVSQDGTFDPTIDKIVEMYQDDEDGFGDFTTTYTIGEGDCSDSVDLTARVIAAEDAEAGDDFSTTFCVEEDEDYDLYSFLSDDAVETGEFSAPYEDGVFNPSVEGAGTYTITYSVNEDNSCVNDSDEATFTIEVNEVNEEDITINIDSSDLEGMTEDEAFNELSSRFAPYFDGIPDLDAFDPELEVAFAELDPNNPEGEYSVSYTENECEVLNFTIIIEDQDEPVVVNPTPGIVCETDVQTTFPGRPEIRAYYLDMLPDGVPEGGSFNPTIDELVEIYRNDEDKIGDFTTIYTVNGESYELTVTVIPVTDANAGDGQSVTYCIDEGEQDLYDLLSEDAYQYGTFVGYENGIFNPSIEGEGIYEITYLVNEDNPCIIGSAEATFTIEVGEGNANAGSDNSGTVCQSDLQELFPGRPEIREYYLDLLDDGVSRDGTFDPTIDKLVEIYQNDEDGLGDFTTTYTVTDGECSDSAELTIRVIASEPAEAGDNFSTTFCSNEEDQNLFSFLSEDANSTGYFEGFEDGIFSPSELGAGEYTFNYIVDEDAPCVEGDDFAEFNIEVFEAPNAGQDISESLCITEAEEMISNPQAAIDWFNSLVDVEGVDQDGSFDPALETLAVQIFAYVSEPDAPSATFETTYTVANENCEDFATITLTINNLEEANAGEDGELTFCVSQGEFDLTDYLSEDANPNGYFEDFDGTINTSELGEGVFNYTYVVDESVDCVTGQESIELTVTIIGDLNAGDDKSVSICNAEIEDGMFPNSTSVRNYYLNMLDEGVSRDGTFSPSIQELVNWYNNESEIGDFTTTYTISEGECSDSAVLTVTVYESTTANVGEIAPQTVCSSDEDIDLFTYLTDDTTTGGTFEGYEDGIFSPSMMGAGSYDVTYTVNEDAPCVEGEASTTFTITVEQGADAGDDMAVTVCSNDGQQDLYSLISADADMDGEFTLDGEVVVDGIMDPAAFEVGTYEVIYTVTAEGDECGGDDMSTITITLGEAPDAPTTGEAIAFCAIDGETAARLEADGTNLTWYSDADLTMMVSEEDLLVDGDYYVTQSSDEGCESEAAVLTVNIVDSPAPTISSNYELCEFDNPTIAALTAEINESGEVTWYDSADSMTALSNNATLTDGTTYYATLISDNGCESSERLAVTVTLEDCALLFPEAITPNGDGRNDRFVIENIEREYPNFNITIFNRWGNAVYKGNASTPTWDGTSNQSGSLGDDVLPVGVYFYVVDFNDGSTEPRQGKVYLNR